MAQTSNRFGLSIAPVVYGYIPNSKGPVDADALLWSGAHVIGHLDLIEEPQQRIRITEQGRGARYLGFDEIRYLHLDNAFIRTDSAHPLAAHSVTSSSALPAQPFSITFRDDQSIEGQVVAFLPTLAGLIFYQLQGNEALSLLLVPHEAAKSYSVGKRIGEMLVESRALTSEELKTALEQQRHQQEQVTATGGTSDSTLLIKTPTTNEELTHALEAESNPGRLDSSADSPPIRRRRLGEILEESGLADGESVKLALAAQLGIPFVRLKGLVIDPSAIEVVNSESAEQLQVMPLMFHDNRLVVAMNDPLNYEASNVLNFLTGHHVEVVLATLADLRWAMHEHYFKNQKQFNEEIHEDITIMEREESEREGSEDAKSLKEQAEARPVVRLVSNIFLDGIARGASDIHLQPQQNRIDLVYRVDGSLLPIRKLNRALYPPVSSRIKVISGMDIAEHRMPQDGQTQIRTVGKIVDLRVSCIPTIYGESLVIRLLDHSSSPDSLDDTGFPSREKTHLSKLLERGAGMVLVTGPTGSGKSTTLQAALKQIKAQERNIITIEDPVEYRIDGVQQIQVNEKIGYTFSRALRNILRHDPDVIMVGEIRDRDTARIAVEAAMTGHLLLSTLHTNSAAETVARYIELGVEPYLLRSAFSGVVAQRLLRLNCENCLEPEPVDDYIRSVLKVNKGERFWRGRGCENCSSIGFKGRAVVPELLVVNDSIRDMIRTDITASEIERQARSDGMVTLAENGVEMARRGITSLAEVYRACVR